MTTHDALLPATVLQRKAVVYVRQSTPRQVQANLESQRRQYELVDVARRRGFTNVEVIDDDLGRTASGTLERPGFDRLVAALCAGQVGAVLCLDASRLARNGRDWHHLLELCGLVEARVIDLDGVYDPCRPNDRLLLGMKGSISEFELGVIRSRMYDAARSKARRGELRISTPIGYGWDRRVGLGLDPNRRLQEVIRLVFQKFRELGSARQVLLWMASENIHFRYPSDGRTLTSFEWRPIRYRNVIAILKNPFYAGVYAYRVEREAHGDRRWPGAQELRPPQADGHVGGVHQGSSRRLHRLGRVRAQSGGARLQCLRQDRRHEVWPRRARPARRPHLLCTVWPSAPRCLHRALSAAGLSVRYTEPAVGAEALFQLRWQADDDAVAGEMLRAVAPMAIEAVREAERMLRDEDQDRRRIAELELSQALYDASLAERRYAACDPDNRLIAAQLEKAWEATLQRVEACRQRLDGMQSPEVGQQLPDLTRLADDLAAAWKAPRTTKRTRQRLVRALVTEIVADVDEAAGEIVLVIHWKGGQHSELRVKKPKTGEHGCGTPEQALAVMRTMAGRWSDQDIAASLNRMGMPTGQGKTWTAHRVGSVRRVNGIHGYLSAEKNGEWLTLRDAATRLDVSHHQVRKLIKAGILASGQIMPDAPHQIRAADLDSEHVAAALARKGRRVGSAPRNQFSMFSDT